jgi:hypothetical protein
MPVALASVEFCKEHRTLSLNPSDRPRSRAAAYIPSVTETQICLFRLEVYTCAVLLTSHKNRGMLFVSQL